MLTTLLASSVTRRQSLLVHGSCWLSRWLLISPFCERGLASLRLQLLQISQLLTRFSVAASSQCLLVLVLLLLLVLLQLQLLRLVLQRRVCAWVRGLWSWAAPASGAFTATFRAATPLQPSPWRRRMPCVSTGRTPWSMCASGWAQPEAPPPTLQWWQLPLQLVQLLLLLLRMGPCCQARGPARSRPVRP